jgi:hypothetical protein
VDELDDNANERQDEVENSESYDSENGRHHQANSQTAQSCILAHSFETEPFQNG